MRVKEQKEYIPAIRDLAHDSLYGLASDAEAELAYFLTPDGYALFEALKKNMAIDTTPWESLVLVRFPE